jgi:hypothetical protein
MPKNERQGQKLRDDNPGIWRPVLNEPANLGLRKFIGRHERDSQRAWPKKRFIVVAVIEVGEK